MKQRSFLPILFATILISGLFVVFWDNSRLTNPGLNIIATGSSTGRKSRSDSRRSSQTAGTGSATITHQQQQQLEQERRSPKDDIDETAFVFLTNDRHREDQDVQTILRRSDMDDTTGSTGSTIQTSTLPVAVTEAERMAAFEFVMSRRTVYETSTTERKVASASRWKMRGVGYLYYYWNMILLAHLPSSSSSSSQLLLQYGRNVVTIQNIMNGNTTVSTGSSRGGNETLLPVSSYIEQYGTPYINCSLWTIYVRVNGPEIFAGSANAVFVTTTTTSQQDNNNTDDADPSRTNSNTNSCFWEFPFLLQKLGTYTVDVKILYYDAASIMESSCTIHSGTVTPDGIVVDQTTTTTRAKRYTKRKDRNNDSTNTTITTTTVAGFKGFKMYTPAEMCCEICSRLSKYECIYWSTPPMQFLNEDTDAEQLPSRTNNGCDLYFPTTTITSASDDWSHTESMFVNNTRPNVPRRTRTRRHLFYHPTKTKKAKKIRARLLRGNAVDYHGPPNGERSTYFIGCGWSFWMTLDFPCLDGDLDDRIYIANNNDERTFTFAATTNSVSSTATASIGDTTMGSNSNESSTHNTNDDEPKLIGDDSDNNNSSWPPTKQQPLRATELPLCTLDMEQPNKHIGRWVRYPWPNATICPNDMKVDTAHSKNFDIMKYDPYHPQCYFRDDLSRIGHDCIEMNCRFISDSSKWMTSSLHLEQQWYGYYEPYHCRYYIDYTDAQLQTCIDERKIYKIDGSGKSIWHFLRQYLYQRISHLTMYNNKAKDGLEIHLSSLQLTHEPTKTLRTKLQKERPLLNPKRMEFYWVNSIYMSSEREQEARGAVQLIKSSIVLDVLGPKNYHMLNLYDMTKAFTYDTATQMDGFHVIGPPMKMLIAKLFHYMCSNTSATMR